MAIKKDTTEEVKEAPEETAWNRSKIRAASKTPEKSYFGCLHVKPLLIIQKFFCR